jgi:hypothetical protein
MSTLFPIVQSGGSILKTALGISAGLGTGAFPLLSLVAGLTDEGRQSFLAGQYTYISTKQQY